MKGQVDNPPSAGFCQADESGGFDGFNAIYRFEYGADAPAGDARVRDQQGADSYCGQSIFESHGHAAIGAV